MTSIIENIVHPASHYLRMRDISGWNGVPDIKSLDCDIVAIKATEGTGYVSPVFQRDWINAKEAGKERIAYHYFHPSVSALAQARFFLDTVKNAGLEDDGLCIDHEETDGLDNVLVAHNGMEFIRAIEAEEMCSVIVYTYLNFARAGNCEGMQHQPLWIADPSHPPQHPEIPKPWVNWAFHQDGVQKGISIDYCNFTSLDVFDKMAVLPKPPPLTPTQRMLHLTDGKAVSDTIVDISNLVEGFRLTIGDAVFEITEDGLGAKVAFP